jgi:hypothetical protein
VQMLLEDHGKQLAALVDRDGGADRLCRTRFGECCLTAPSTAGTEAP